MSKNGKATANPYRGESSLVIGGKERTLRFGLNAAVRFQQETGLLLVEAGERLAKFDAIVLRAVIWAGIGDQELSPEEVGDMVETDIEAGAYDLTALLTVVGNALARSFGMDVKSKPPKKGASKTEQKAETT